MSLSTVFKTGLLQSQQVRSVAGRVEGSTSGHVAPRLALILGGYSAELANNRQTDRLHHRRSAAAVVGSSSCFFCVPPSAAAASAAAAARAQRLYDRGEVGTHLRCLLVVTWLGLGLRIGLGLGLGLARG